MTDRLLSVEFAPLSLVGREDTTGGWIFNKDSTTDYRPLPGSNNQYWVSEHKLDLSGYQREDLTVYFRNSFEQRGSFEAMQWEATQADPLSAYDVGAFEVTIISSVPMSDENLVGAVFYQPGFIPVNFGLDYGNFNRTHIIHGSAILHGLDTAMGTDSLTARGAGYTRTIQYNEFSSLEPTAADCLYCYRLFALSQSYDRKEDKSRLFLVGFAPKRVLLNIMTDKEPQLEYMMRLKRSYELANQV